jgi:hypothetical protein
MSVRYSDIRIAGTALAVNEVSMHFVSRMSQQSWPKLMGVPQAGDRQPRMGIELLGDNILQKKFRFLNLKQRPWSTDPKFRDLRAQPV